MHSTWGMLAGAALLAIAAHHPAHAAEARSGQETHVGGLLILKLPGNPSAGYKWQLNTEESRGLHLVDVQQVGWILAPQGLSMFFRENSTLNVAVRGKSPGEAALAFDYIRSWGRRPGVRTTVVRVTIKPAETAQSGPIPLGQWISRLPSR